MQAWQSFIVPFGMFKSMPLAELAGLNPAYILFMLCRPGFCKSRPDAHSMFVRAAHSLLARQMAGEKALIFPSADVLKLLAERKKARARRKMECEVSRRIELSEFDHREAASLRRHLGLRWNEPLPLPAPHPNRQPRRPKRKPLPDDFSDIC